MTFPTKFARALVPVAVFAAAAPAAAADSADMARLKAHISGVHTMTANFVQTDSRGRSAAGKMDLERPGKVRFDRREEYRPPLLRAHATHVRSVSLGGRGPVLGEWSAAFEYHPGWIERFMEQGRDGALESCGRAEVA